MRLGTQSDRANELINHFWPWISDRLRDFHQAVVVSVSLATGSLEIEFVCHNLLSFQLLAETVTFRINDGQVAV